MMVQPWRLRTSTSGFELLPLCRYVVAVSLLLVAACGGNDDLRRYLAPCSSSSQCESGLCQKGVCTHSCTKASDCCEGDSCEKLLCLDQVCHQRGENLKPGAVCQLHQECSSEICIEGRCAFPCAADVECPAGLRCHADGFCLKPLRDCLKSPCTKECMTGGCDPFMGCLPTKASMPCGENRCKTVCDGIGHCKARPKAKSCDDGAVCTVDACDPKTAACKHTPKASGTACDSNRACTDSSACSCSLYNKTYSDKLSNGHTATEESLVAVVPAGGKGAWAVGLVDVGPNDADVRALIVRRDVAGKSVWANHYGGDQHSELHGVVGRPAGGVWAVGRRVDGDHFSAWVLSLDKAGDVVSETTHGLKQRDRILRDVRWLDSKTLVSVGVETTASGVEHALLISFGLDGKMVGDATVMSAKSGARGFYAVAVDPKDQTVYAAGYETPDSTAVRAGLLARISVSGQLKTEVVSNGKFAAAFHDLILHDKAGLIAVGERIVPGATPSVRGWLVMVDQSLGAQKSFTSGGGGAERFFAVTPAAGDEVIAAGTSTSGSNGKGDGWLRGFDLVKSSWSKLDKKIGLGETDLIEAVHYTEGRLLAVGTSASYGSNQDAWQLSMTVEGTSACALSGQ